MTTLPISGGCLCGRVRYTVDGPPEKIVHCHCSVCRRSYASLVGTGAQIKREQVKIEKGENNLTSYQMPSGDRRQFCRTCGCSLFYFVSDLSESMFYFPATLDGGIHPGHPEGSECHVYVGSKAEWEHFSDTLPRFDKSSLGTG